MMKKEFTVVWNISQPVHYLSRSFLKTNHAWFLCNSTFWQDCLSYLRRACCQKNTPGDSAKLHQSLYPLVDINVIFLFSLSQSKTSLYKLYTDLVLRVHVAWFQNLASLMYSAYPIFSMKSSLMVLICMDYCSIYYELFICAFFFFKSMCSHNL